MGLKGDFLVGKGVIGVGLIIKEGGIEVGDF